MKPLVPSKFRHDVQTFIVDGFVWRQSVGEYVRRGELYSTGPYSSVSSDIGHYRRQIDELQSNGLPYYVALFKDEGETLPVLLQLPDFTRIQSSYMELAAVIRGSNLKVAEVSKAEAQKIFVDRVAEFLMVSGSSTPATPTTVHSKKNGDTILYAKGYFTSTGTAFGVSTPASFALKPGRYSFGVMASGKPKFDPILWTCPHSNVRIKLP